MNRITGMIAAGTNPDLGPGFEHLNFRNRARGQTCCYRTPAR